MFRKKVQSSEEKYATFQYVNQSGLAEPTTVKAAMTRGDSMQ